MVKRRKSVEVADLTAEDGVLPPDGDARREPARSREGVRQLRRRRTERARHLRRRRRRRARSLPPPVEKQNALGETVHDTFHRTRTLRVGGRGGRVRRPRSSSGGDGAEGFRVAGALVAPQRAPR